MLSDNCASEANPTAPLFITLPKAAKRIGVSPNTIRGMARSGSLPVVMVGQRQMVPEAMLSAEWFLTAQANAKSNPNGDCQ